LGLILSPPLALIAKTENLRALHTFSHIGKRNMSEELYQLRVPGVTAKDK
jgi:hypothetical protein